MSQQKTASTTPELEALYQAARQIETSLIRERAQTASVQAGHHAEIVRHKAELEQTRQQALKLAAREQALAKHLAEAQGTIQDYATYCANLKAHGERGVSDLQETIRKNELNLTAARASFHQMRKKNHELQEAVDRLLPELTRTRDELDRAQGEVLDREHRYQASVLSYQGRDRHQLDAIQAIKDQLKSTQDELSQTKSRWRDAERLRQESEEARQEAELAMKRQIPANQKLKELSEANHSLEQRIAIERRQRQEADASVQLESQEKERLLSALRAAEDRLSYTEARLAKAMSEASLLKAARKAQPRPAPSARRPDPLDYVDPMELETLERLALPGFPVQGLD